MKPAIRIGVVGVGVRHVTESMFLAAADALVAATTPAELEAGAVYPAIERMLAVSLNVAESVARTAYAEGLASVSEPTDLRDHLAARAYDPRYPAYV